MSDSDDRYLREEMTRRDMLLRTGAVAAGAAVAGSSLGALVGVAEAASPVTISVREHQKIRVDYLNSIVPHFESAMKKAGHRVKVNVQVGDTNDATFEQKLVLDYAQGKGPDVTSFGKDYVPDLVAAHRLANDTKYLNRWGAWHSQWYPIMRHDVTTHGRQFTIPREAAVMSLYYRHDLLTKYGISTAQPRNWADLLDRARRIKKKTGLHANSSNPGEGVLLFPAGSQWGGGTFAEGFIHLMLGTKSKLFDAKHNKWVCKSAGLLAVFTFYQTLAKEGLLPVNGLLAPNPWQPTKYIAFPQEKLAITTSGTWAWEFDWGAKGAAPISNIFHKVSTWKFPPQHHGSPFVYAGLNWVWAIDRASKHNAEAMAFVEYIMKPQLLSQDLALTGNVSPRADAKKYAPYSHKPYIYKEEKAFSSGRYFQPQNGQDQIITLLGQATDSLITQSKSPHQAMNDFYNGAIQLLGSGHVEAE